MGVVGDFYYKRDTPRRSRIDAPGALHHIIVRGIERKTIFKDDADKDNFLERLKNILIYDSVDLLRFKKSGYKILWIVCLTHTAYCANFFEKIVNQQSHI